jgi:hypothetical protein
MSPGVAKSLRLLRKARQRTIVQAIFFLIENDFPRPTPFSIREPRLHGLPADQPVAKAPTIKMTGMLACDQ